MRLLVRYFQRLQFKRTTLLAALCGSVLAGIGLARFLYMPSVLIVFGIVLVAACAHRRKLAALSAVVLLGLAIGGVRGALYMDRLAEYKQLYGQTVVLEGKAVDDAGYGRKSQLAFDLAEAREVDATGRAAGKPMVGRIGVSGFGTNEILRGDTVRVEGKIRQGKGSRQGYMSYAELAVVKSEQTYIDIFRRKFAAGMQSALPEPAASFAMGILIGQKSTLPDSVYTDLQMVGLIHIIAVSGYNLTIILRACLKLLGNRSKYQTFTVAITLISIFLLITGASASIVRASIVSALSLVAWYYGRSFRPILLILFAAAITAYASPLYPWSDIGWYLSFLAFYGVMILSPQVRERFMTGWLKTSVLFGILLESLAAEVMTLPLVLYIFGQMSHVSLIANVLVAAFVPIAMLLSLIAGLAGMLATSVCGWFGWPAAMVLTYMLDTAHILASIPHIFLENVYLTLAGMVAMYSLVVAFNVVLYNKLREDKSKMQTLRDENALLRSHGKQLRTQEA